MSGFRPFSHSHSPFPLLICSGFKLDFSHPQREAHWVVASGARDTRVSDPFRQPYRSPHCPIQVTLDWLASLYFISIYSHRPRSGLVLPLLDWPTSLTGLTVQYSDTDSTTTLWPESLHTLLSSSTISNSGHTVFVPSQIATHNIFRMTKVLESV